MGNDVILRVRKVNSDPVIGDGIVGNNDILRMINKNSHLTFGNDIGGNSPMTYIDQMDSIMNRSLTS